MPKYHVHRSIVLNASPLDVYNVVADFSTWSSWSPWLCCEPDAKVTVSKDSSSVGSMYDWEGELVGAGEIEHKDLKPGELIDDEIRFKKPFKSVSQVSFDFEPVAEGTRVTWHMRGALPWFMFWMTSMMETFIGRDYERGLMMLKEWIETGSVLSQTTIDGLATAGPLQILGVRKSCSFDDIGPSMESAFAEVKELMNQHGLPVDGQGVSVYHHVDMKQRTFDFTSGFAVDETVTNVPTGLVPWSTPEVKALSVQHVGRYDHLGNAWSAAYQYCRYKKIKPKYSDGFEIYTNDCNSTSEAELHTQIYVPVKG